MNTVTSKWLETLRAVKTGGYLPIIFILAMGAALRLWRIDSLFNVLHDYDEGAYSLGGRFITDGLVPYRDYLLVHPPFYNIVLAGVYKVFGYDFFYGRYLSVFLSLGCILLLYLVARRLYSVRAGLVAATLFAVCPMMTYLGRRAVQETLGLFLVLAALYFISRYLGDNRKINLVLSGLILGLTAATKYLFIPVFLGILIALLTLALYPRLKGWINLLGKLNFWLTYLSFFLFSLSLLLFLRWGLGMRIPVPPLEPVTQLNLETSLVLFFVLLIPFFTALAFCIRLVKDITGTENSKPISVVAPNLVLAGASVSFCIAIAFFLIKAPGDFINQTLLLQSARSSVDFPSFFGVLHAIPKNEGFLKLISLPILLLVPVSALLISQAHKANFSVFLGLIIISGFALSQFFAPMPRYYAPLFPLLYLGIAGLSMPERESTGGKYEVRTTLLVTLVVILLTLSVSLLRNYTGYDTLRPGPVYSSCENAMYSETLDYLKSVDAKKIFATSPSFPALAPNLETIPDFDIFASLFLEKKSAKKVAEKIKGSNADYVLLDSWIRYWGYQEEVLDFSNEIRASGQLVKVVQPDSSCRVEIYRMGVSHTGFFNGTFENWVTDLGKSAPLGWEPFSGSGIGDSVSFKAEEKEGRRCLKLEVFENGKQDDKLGITYVGLSQALAFPDGKVKLAVLPLSNSVPQKQMELVQGVHFLDKVSGRAMILGFSDVVDSEAVFLSENGSRELVLKKTKLGGWSEIEFELGRYWNEAGWPRPEKIEALIILSTNYATPGRYSFYISEIGLVLDKN